MDELKEHKPKGKKPGQKYKSLLVWDVLLKRTDENHALRLKDIKEHLEHYGISAERHSIKRDIDDMMDFLSREQEFDLDEMELEERDLMGYEVEYDSVQHGYKVVRRPYEFDDLRLLAECVRSSKFISKRQEEGLLAAIESLCSEYQVEELQNEVYLIGRNKTSNKYTMASMLTINQAIRQNRKISFRYQKYTIQDRTQQVDRHGGKVYIVSPYKLVISDSNYYLLAWNSTKGKVITYRLDRMRAVSAMQEPREGEMEFAKINMRAYTQQHFGMFSGENKKISLRFDNALLDTAVEKFGTDTQVFYRPDGVGHFIVSAEVAISDQFFGWLCGFRDMVQILSPSDVIADFQNFLDAIYKKYQIE